MSGIRTAYRGPGVRPNAYNVSVAGKRSWTDEQLRAAVAGSTSYGAASRALGLSGKGAHWGLKQRVRELSLDTSHFTGTSTRATRAWSNEELATAVANSTSFPQTIERLGLELCAATYQLVRRYVKVLALDTSHFQRTVSEHRASRRWSDDQLRDAVAASRSIAGALRRVGLIPAGGNYDQIQRRIKALELDTSHFTGQGWNVGGGFKPTIERPLDEVLVAGRWSSSHHLKLRLIRAGLKEPCCELCGWAEQAADGRIPIELDHVNGDRHDNRLSNLRILCPNCHALQPTHRGLNKKRRVK